MKKILKRYLSRSTFKVPPQSLKLSQKRGSLLKGLRILHISDLHIDTKTPYDEIIYLIDTINQTDCDFVILSGDIIDTKVEKIKDRLLPFKKINKTVYFVTGNHDLVYGYHTLHKIFKEFNIISLDNRYEVLKYGDVEFVLWGLSDRFSKYFNIKRDEKKLVETVKEFKIPKIFISHQPKDYEYGIYSESDIFLSGHTHGGQIFPFHLLVRIFQPFLNGVYYKDKMAIYINSGIGSWGVKYRFLSKGEITIIEVE